MEYKKLSEKMKGMFTEEEWNDYGYFLNEDGYEHKFREDGDYGHEDLFEDVNVETE